MKYIILLATCLMFSSVEAQDYNFSVGLVAQPYFYKNYNKSDWNNLPSSYPDNPSGFNGFGIGFTAQKPITDNLGVMMELVYSKDSQEHTLLAGTPADSSSTDYRYGRKAKTLFDILKLPLMISYNTEIGYNSGFFIDLHFGPQVSYLLDYYSEFIAYGWKSNFYSYNTIRTPNNQTQDIWEEYYEPPQYRHKEIETPYLYTKWLFGVVGGVELQKVLYDNFVIGFGGRFEYDFTNSEKYPDRAFVGLGGAHDLGWGWGNRTKSHNVRMGFSLSVQYRFE